MQQPEWTDTKAYMFCHFCYEREYIRWVMELDAKLSTIWLSLSVHSRKTHWNKTAHHFIQDEQVRNYFL